MERAARLTLNVYVIGALFTPFAVAVHWLGAQQATPPGIGQLILLFLLVAVPTLALRRLRLFAAPETEPTPYD